MLLFLWRLASYMLASLFPVRACQNMSLFLSNLCGDCGWSQLLPALLPCFDLKSVTLLGNRSLPKDTTHNGEIISWNGKGTLAWALTCRIWEESGRVLAVTSGRAGLAGLPWQLACLSHQGPCNQTAKDVIQRALKVKYAYLYVLSCSKSGQRDWTVSAGYLLLL